MKFQILNNEQVGFYDEGGNLKATIQVSNNDLVIEPASSDGNIVFGENTIRDVEIGSISTPSNLTFLGGGTISSNGNTLYLGDINAGDNVVVSGVQVATDYFSTGSLVLTGTLYAQSLSSSLGLRVGDTATINGNTTIGGNITIGGGINAAGNIIANSASFYFIQPGGFIDENGTPTAHITIKGGDSTADEGVGGDVIIKGGDGTPQAQGIVYIGPSTGETNADSARTRILGALSVNATGPNTGGSLRVDGGGGTVLKILYNNTNNTTSWITSRNLLISGANTYRFDKSAFYIGTDDQGTPTNGVSASFEFKTRVYEAYDSTLQIRAAGNPGGYGYNGGLYLRKSGYDSNIGTANYDSLFFRTGMFPNESGTIRGGYTYNGKFAWGDSPSETAAKVFTIHSTAEFKNGLTVSGSLDVTSNLSIQGNQINFTNLPTSNPGVAGRLFRTSSEAIGASAGFQIVCVSQG
jgi:hypothetical protein